MQNEKRIKKLVFSSHDRQNLNDDSSSFDIQFDQITEVSQFILRKAYIPLSTSTFQEADDDRTWEINSVQNPIKINNNTLVNQFMNFAYYTPPPLFGYGTINGGEGFRVRLDGNLIQKNAPQSQNSIALRVFNSVSESNNVSYLQTFALNESVNFATLAQNLQSYCSSQTSLPGYILSGLRWFDNWQTPFFTNLDAKNEAGAQTIFSHPDQDDLGRDVLYFYNKSADQDFVINLGFFYWNSLSSKYDIPIDKGTLSVNMNGISTKTSIGHYVYGIRPPGGSSNYDTEVIGFQTNTVYTNASLVAWLNSQVAFNRFGITFSKVQRGNNVGLDDLVITSTPNTGYRRIDPVNGDVTIFRRLGFRFKSLNPTKLFTTSDYIGPWENLNIPVPNEPINIYYEIRCNNVIQIFTGTNLWSDLIKQGSFIGTIAESGTGEADYIGLKINLEIVKDPNPVNPGYYSVKMSSPDPNCQRLSLRIDDNIRPFYVPTEGPYYYDLTSPAQGLLFQPYLTNVTQTIFEKNVWWPNSYPDEMYVSFDTTVYYTEASLLSTIQVITTLTPALTFSIINHKLSISNSSEAKGYVFEANDRLGIPEEITLPPLTTKIMKNDLDLSSLNDVVYVGLSLYSDGSNGVNKNIRLTGRPEQPRPQRKNICASIVNTNDTNYGKYLIYDNQTDDWMACDRTDFSNIHVDVYDSEYNLLNLNGITTHFSVIFR